MAKRKQPKSWSDRLDPAQAIEETVADQSAKVLANSIEKDMFKGGMPVLEGLIDQLHKNECIQFAEPKPKPYSMQQIEVMTLQRELHLAKAEILELKLKAAGVSF